MHRLLFPKRNKIVQPIAFIMKRLDLLN